MRRRIIRHGVILLFLTLALIVPAGAYSVQSHQQLIDLSWKLAIEPLLLDRFPGLNAGQLREAHAYAYGGCAIQDLGYYPFGDKFFSDLLHYVRSGDFVQALLRDANSPDELAFALGALSHYVGDSLGHSIATNYAVPVEFPGLRAQYGDWVTYDEDPHAHVQAEFAFDINEISKDRFAPVDYLESVGLEVPLPLLSRAFRETYGIPLTDVLGGSQHPNLFGYRLSVHHWLPRIAVAEVLLHGPAMPPDTPGPELDHMVQELQQSGLDNGWQKFRRPPGFGAHLLAALVRLTPKISAATMLAIKGPTVQTEQNYVRSMNRSIGTMRSILSDLRTNGGDAAQDLPNRDLDTGMYVQPGAYRLTDVTYQKLLHDLTHKPAHCAPLALRQNIETYYSRPEAFGSHLGSGQWRSIHADLKLLEQQPSPADCASTGDCNANSTPPKEVFRTMFFDSWMGLARVLIIGVLAYVALVLMLRISGKRTLSKMNAFDLIVTVALGSTLASLLLSKQTALAEGLLALALLIGLQFIVAWLSVHSIRFSHLVKATPRLLFFNGNFLQKEMEDERVTQDEVLAAIRAGGTSDLAEVGAVVLETDGSFTVLPPVTDPAKSSLRTARGIPKGN